MTNFERIRKKEQWSMSKALTQKQIDWAYDKWCLGFTQAQIAQALYVCEKTVARALKDKPRIRPLLKYDENNS